MTNETFHKLLKKMCGSAGIGCDKCPLNEPKKKAGGTCKEYIEDHGLAVRDIVKGWALERGLLPDNGNQEKAPDTRREILQAAHIDLKEWTAEWKEYTGEDAGFHYCSKCKQQAFNYEDGGELVEVLSDFCPGCARAMTEKGMAELEKRLRG